MRSSTHFSSDEHEYKIKEMSKLDSLGRNLTELAEKNKLNLVYEREDEIRALATHLSSGERSVMIVGRSGVGKNAVVEGLSKWIIAKRLKTKDARLKCITPSLAKMQIIESGAEQIISDCSRVGDLETRVREIFNECIKHKAILFLDNINLAINAGSAGNCPDRTLANVLSSYMSSHGFVLIGATTTDGYKFITEENPSFANRFVRLDVEEPTADQTKKVLFDLKKDFEKKAKLRIDNESIEELVTLSDRFYTEQCFPGKVFNLLNDTISLAKVDKQNLSKEYIYKTFMRLTGLPEFIIKEETPLKKDDIKEFFKDRLNSQEEAIDAMADAVVRYKTKLNPPDKPVATFLFCGPTGVGKTEAAKLLSDYLYHSRDKLLVYDMPNYCDYEGINRLIGSSQSGIIDKPGKLIRDVMYSPRSVVLFDEIEKVPMRILNLLLPILDEGRLVDSVGRTAQFNNAFVIMTSNLGADFYTKTKSGFSNEANEEDNTKDINKELQTVLGSEFLNRIDYVVHFRPLSREDVEQIVRRQVDDVLKRRGILERGLSIDVDDAVISLLADHGYSKEYGARAVQRTITKTLISSLAELVSEQSDLKKAFIKFTVSDGGVKVESQQDH